MKEYAKKGELTKAMAELILSEQKPKERKLTIKAEKVSQYFPEDYTEKEMEAVILELLEEWKSRG